MPDEDLGEAGDCQRRFDDDQTGFVTDETVGKHGAALGSSNQIDQSREARARRRGASARPRPTPGRSSMSPVKGRPGRAAWHGWSGDGDQRLDVHHAWLVEDLSADRVRILTQETQNGSAAKKMAIAVPNPMVNGHQEWLDGLVAAVRSSRPEPRGRRP